MNLAELNKVARAMVTPGKGLLAADESSGTIKKRFDDINVESTEETRRDYREMLFRTGEAMTQCISGVILYDETIWQDGKDGTPLIKLIEQAGAVPGIKVDEGTQALPACPGERVTVGLDHLAGRLKRYYDRGARFAKWRVHRSIDWSWSNNSGTGAVASRGGLASGRPFAVTRQMRPWVTSRRGSRKSTSPCWMIGLYQSAM